MLGLIVITLWSAMQYILLANVPDTVPQFAFLCVTNAIGVVMLCAFRFRHIGSIRKSTLVKGAALALELCGFNFFLLIGSKGTDSVIASSILSMYFIFVTPLLLLMKRTVSFRSVVAGLIAIISLLLLFGADTSLLFSSKSTVYLLIGAFFFALYVVTISVFGEDEDSSSLSMCQIAFAAVFSFVGWVIETGVTGVSFALPSDRNFWIAALFIGIFIRALYTLIQVTAQKYVQPIKASLVFSSEIIISLFLNPILSKFYGTEAAPITTVKIIGCLFFVIAMLIIDDGFMKKFGYQDMEDVSYVNSDGELVKGTSVSRKTVNMTLIISIVALTLSTFVCMGAISRIKATTVQNSTNLGQNAARESEEALKSELEKSITRLVTDKAEYANAKFSEYASNVSTLAAYAETLLAHPENYAARESMYPLRENGGIWAMQRGIASELIDYESLRDENALMGNMEDVFAPIVSNLDNVATIYIGLESGLMVSYDKYSDTACSGGEIYYEYRESEWYNLGKESDGAVFTSAYQDGYGRGLTVTCLSPFDGPDGTFYGVVAADILVDDINDTLVNSGIEEPAEAVLLNNEGYVIAGRCLSKTADESLHITDAAINSPVGAVVENVLKNGDGIAASEAGEEAYYVAYSTIEFTDWHLCVSSPVADVIEPAVRIRESIDNNTAVVAGAVEDGIRSVIENCLILFAVIILLITFLVGKYSQRISQPLKRLEQDVRDISSGNLSLRTNVKTDDEIGSLATTFNSMASSLQDYIVELKDVTAKEERIASELTFATQIQAAMLPRNYPAFPDRHEFDIYGSMDPAKEVGGDLYDFFLIDDSHLGIAVADVSGKGVPAALFMVIAKTLMKDRALLGGKPSEILTFVNERLIESNDAGMFVTAWFGILDLKTGIITATNAGHEYPVIGKSGGGFDLIKDRHGLALAAMEGAKYRDYEIELKPGDKLLIYTDGVAEATDAENQLFGTDRLLDALNAKPFTSCEQTIADVTEAINAFVKEVPQFDDITMLCLQFKEYMSE